MNQNDHTKEALELCAHALQCVLHILGGSDETTRIDDTPEKQYSAEPENSWDVACVACGGTGKNSKGGECVACGGTGDRRKRDDEASAATSLDEASEPEAEDDPAPENDPDIPDRLDVRAVLVQVSKYGDKSMVSELLREHGDGAKSIKAVAEEHLPGLYAAAQKRLDYLRKGE